VRSLYPDFASGAPSKVQWPLRHRNPDHQVAKALPLPSGASATTINISDVGVLRALLRTRIPVLTDGVADVAIC
jgi:hypothetical protein